MTSRKARQKVKDASDEEERADALEELRKHVNTQSKLKNEIEDLETVIKSQGAEIERLLAARTKLIVLQARVEARIREACQVKTLGAVFRWNFLGEDVRGTGSFSVNQATAADADSPLTGVRIVVPSRRVDDFLCPTQLPSGTLSTTSTTSDTLTCSGGSLAVGEQFAANVRTTPPASAGMGGQLYGLQDGTYKGPFAITGP